MVTILLCAAAFITIRGFVFSVHSFMGFVVLRFGAFVVLWFIGMAHRWFSGSSARRISGSLPLRLDASVVLQFFDFRVSGARWLFDFVTVEPVRIEYRELLGVLNTQSVPN